MKGKLTNLVRMVANLSKGWLAAGAICVALVVVTLGGLVGRLTKPAPAPQTAPMAVEVNELADDTVDASDTTTVEDTAEVTTAAEEDTDITEDTTVEDAVDTTEVPIVEEPTPLLEELMDSDDPSDWLLAAQQPDATSADLEELAQRAAVLDEYDKYSEDIQMSCDILDAIAAHEAVTPDALRSFLASPHTEVWLELAKQPADEGTLILLARQVAALDQMELNSTYEEDEKEELAIAQALASNPASTTQVMAELKRAAFDSVQEVKLT